MLTLHSDSAAGASAVLTPQQQSLLAERIRRGETSAEEELDRLFRSRVLFLALARTHDPEAARDVTQDVMLAVVLALRDGHLREAERLAAFVYGTARNVISSYLRTRSRLPKEDPIGDGLHRPRLPDPIEHTERADLIQRALRVLESTDRKILLLTLVEGLKPGEIAVRLGLTAEVVRTRKSRALKKTIERMKKLSRT
jgi:RNA polymerase sigma-70 factor (ECF subfamily)